MVGDYHIEGRARLSGINLPIGEVNVKLKRQKNIVALALGLATTLTIGGVGSFAAEKASGSTDAVMERTRQEFKMLHDLYKNMIVLIDGHYVKMPFDIPATASATALFAAMKKNGWHE